MDAFFASVEQRDSPHLAGQPVVVANSTQTVEQLRELAAEARERPHGEYLRGVRGVVASASYEARIFGVRSAMPLARALVLCPDAVVLEGRFGRYGEVARQLQAVWSEFSPVIEPVSFDEAYLDLTGSELAGGRMERVGQRLKDRIREATGLTASVGIATNKLVAKIASDLDKPDGLVIVAQGDEARTLAPLHARALPGIGPRTGEALATLGINTVGELAAASFDVLARAFGADHAAGLLRRAVGLDDAPVEPPGDPKSISREITLDEDSCDLEYLRSRLRELSDHVAWSLRQEGYAARCVYIKLRLLPVKRVWTPESSGFGRLITRQTTVPIPTQDAGQVHMMAVSLLGKAASRTGLAAGKEVVRLVGVGTANLTHIEVQSRSGLAGQARSESREEVTPNVGEKRDRLNARVDQIRNKFGFGSIAIGAPTENGNANNRDAG
jgi:DNA polymerase-4